MSCEDKPEKTAGIAVDKSELLTEIIPDNQKKAYDVKKVIETFVDENSFLPLLSRL